MAASFGPRVESASSEAPAAAALDATDATPPSAAFPLVDAETLLQKIKDSGQRGVVVNAWASWCDPCREELPMLARVAPQLAARGVPIWLVSVDDPDGFAAAKALLDSLHINDVSVVYGKFHIFKVWGLEDSPALIIGMDVLGTVASLSIDFKNQEIYVASVREGGRLSPGQGILGDSTQKK